MRHVALEQWSRRDSPLHRRDPRAKAAVLLVFLVDQTQQLCCPLFQAAWNKRGHNKRSLWEKMRNLFDSFVFASMQELYEAIINGFARQPLVLLDSS